MADTYDRNKFLIVKVSDDHMKVYLSVKPFAQENIEIKVDDVVKFLKKPIASSINEELIKTTLDKVRQDNFPTENVLVSEGTAVIHGDDGKLEFLFNADKKIKPHKDTGGKVDCTIYAKNIVKAGGDKISIEGGITTAGTLIEVEALGSKNEVYTDVEAGIDYTIHPDKINTRKEISGLKSFLKKVDKELNTLYAIKKAKGELPAQYVATFDHHLSGREELVRKLRNLVSNEVVPVNTDAKVVVNKVAHAGVEIKIGEPAITLLEECTRLTIFCQTMR